MFGAVLLEPEVLVPPAVSCAVISVNCFHIIRPMSANPDMMIRIKPHTTLPAASRIQNRKMNPSSMASPIEIKITFLAAFMLLASS